MNQKNNKQSKQIISEEIAKSSTQEFSEMKPKGRDILTWPKSLSGKLYGVLVLFFGFILITSLFSWKSLLELVDIQKILAEKNIPELVLATNIIQQSERLIQSAPQLIASSSEDSLNQVKKEIEQDHKVLKQYLSNFEKSVLSQNSLQIRKLINEMMDNLSSIEQSVEQQRQLMRRLNNRSVQMRDLDRNLYKTLVIKIDDKTFDLAIQSKAVSSSIEKVSKSIQLEDILHYKELMNLQSQINLSASLLREVISLSNSDLIQPIRERFLASIRSCERSVKSFSSSHKEIREGIRSFKQLGLGQGASLGIFDLKRKVLKIGKTQNQYLEKNRKIANKLSETVKNINLNIKTRGKDSTVLFRESLRKNKTVLFIINALSFLGCLIVAVFLVAPLIRRLIYLAKKMKTMSKGDLQNRVEVQGSDEVAEMASALEVFRCYALEVQRLNLVEKLMKEVQTKNKILEETVNHLHKTQNQLVMQEKLASLGQLTAGIAHEIKNPLNFINNFSKLSKDLLKDIHQEFEKVKAHIKEETYAFIQEIMNDLQSNMEKISSHGNRANDIIMGMLEHSRVSKGQKEFVDINRYMEIYSNLAFHSKRASN
ncbi:MAG: HAMP domain-containing protein, partial [Oligoflexia bacterium]|nr:HAMP domain-containing protein [Oligoflexia bacterium]